MKQLLIELDDELAQKLERVTPRRSRRRSEFVRSAIRKALWELEERLTAEAYRRVPDGALEAYFDPGVWTPAPSERSRRRKK